MTEMQKILIVEDDKGLQKQLKWAFGEYDVAVADDRASAMEVMRRSTPAVVTLDLGLPPDPDGASEGLATLEMILRDYPATKVIMVTGNEAREHAIRAVGLGAYDFYQKPVDHDEMLLIIRRALRLHELEEENRQLARSSRSGILDGILTGSPAMLEVCRQVERLAPLDATVFISGESGTGKELIARALHNGSPRREGRFVAINSAAIPGELLESELFGYEKGAFTGATARKIGKIEDASGGTLFLDEIGDMPVSLQAKLLRFIQERVVERLGGRSGIEVDTRIVCATHQDMSSLIAAGRFREDLYYRVSEIEINLPPLRERDGDAIMLAHHFINRFCQEYRLKPKKIAPDAADFIESSRWPGNIRELESRVKRAVLMTDRNIITAADLGATDSGGESDLSLRTARETAELRALQKALSIAGGNITRAAELLEVTRPTLYSLMSKYSIKQPE